MQWKSVFCSHNIHLVWCVGRFSGGCSISLLRVGQESRHTLLKKKSKIALWKTVEIFWWKVEIWVLQLCEILELPKEVWAWQLAGRMLCGKRTLNRADWLLVGHCQFVVLFIVQPRDRFSISCVLLCIGRIGCSSLLASLAIFSSLDCFPHLSGILCA